MATTVIGYIAFSQLIQHLCEAILGYFHVATQMKKANCAVFPSVKTFLYRLNLFFHSCIFKSSLNM